MAVAAALEDIRVPTRYKLSAMWASVMFCYIYADYFGLYVPGSSAAYPSSVLMNAVPAQVAGVERIVMVSPAPGGKINPLVLVAAPRAVAPGP